MYEPLSGKTGRRLDRGQERRGSRADDLAKEAVVTGVREKRPLDRPLLGKLQRVHVHLGNVGVSEGH